MIQNVLVFLFGALSATLIALAVGPALWRRAVRLTEKRVLSSMPMTPNEIEAEKDRMRAAFAMEIRQIEMKLEGSRNRIAALMVDLGHAEENTRLKSLSVTALESDRTALARDLAAAREEATRLSAALHIANEAFGRSEAKAALLAAEKDALELLQEETALKAGSLQVELAENEGELARLGNAMRGMGDIGADEADATGAAKSTPSALRAERRKSAELEKKLAATEARLAASELDRGRRQAKSLAPGEPVDGSRRGGNVLSLDNARIAAENAVLREQVLDLAARMVAATAARADSPVNAMLRSAKDDGLKTSALADRIRALQKSASSGRN
ncbi:MAG: hypothetical protein IPL47_09915 [Phyllobacteriaceae bacterium]|nr:hypothetical protein [Phyllobacteriaceae bacterium]